MDLQGLTALVTGASSGIGEAMAKELAARGADLVLVARRRDRLETLAESLRAAHKVRVEVLAVDLGAAGAAEEVFARTEGQGRPVDVLINNAGFGVHDSFVAIPWDKTRAQLDLNVTALTELTYRFLRAMVARNKGWIMNVASVGAYMPVPSYATYAAGKAYVRSFSEALAHELRRTRVRVSCLCPGATATEFMEVAGHALPPFARLALMSSERCARIGLAGLFGGRRNVVAGWLNAFTMFLFRFLPRRATARLAAIAMSAPPPVEAPRLPGSSTAG